MERIATLQGLDNFCRIHYETIFYFVQGVTVQVLSSDVVMSWLHATEKIAEASIPYRKFENGHTERNIQAVMNMALSLIHGDEAPIKLWSYAVIHATHTLIVPTTTRVFPMEMLVGRSMRTSLLK